MSLVEKLALGLVIVFLVVAALRLFSAPLKIALRLGINALLGFCALLGLPGLGLLLLLQWVLT